MINHKHIWNDKEQLSFANYTIYYCNCGAEGWVYKPNPNKIWIKSHGKMSQIPKDFVEGNKKSKAEDNLHIFDNKTANNVLNKLLDERRAIIHQVHVAQLEKEEGAKIITLCSKHETLSFNRLIDKKIASDHLHRNICLECYTTLNRLNSNNFVSIIGFKYDGLYPI